MKDSDLFCFQLEREKTPSSTQTKDPDTKRRLPTHKRAGPFLCLTASPLSSSSTASSSLSQGREWISIPPLPRSCCYMLPSTRQDVAVHPTHRCLNTRPALACLPSSCTSSTPTLLAHPRRKDPGCKLATLEHAAINPIATNDGSGR